MVSELENGATTAKLDTVIKILAAFFHYGPEWLMSEQALPISLSMPLSDRVWSGKNVTSYFDGLLPDDRTIRERIAAREHADSASIYNLLAIIGRDCVGVLQFVPEGDDPGYPRKMDYRKVTDDEITKRIAVLGKAPLLRVIASCYGTNRTHS